MENVLIGPSGLLRILLHLAFWFVSSTCWSLFSSWDQSMRSRSERSEHRERRPECALCTLSLRNCLGQLSLLNEECCSSQGHFLYSLSFPVLVTASIPDPFTNSLGLATARLLWLVMGYCTIPMLPLCSTHSENVTLPLSATTLTNTTQHEQY